jgi:predicted transcriptional regulator
MKTIDQIKEKRVVSDELKERVKAMAKINRKILSALKDSEKTIPEIATETKLESQMVTYHLMTLLKYGKIEAGEIDDMDEYYYYKLKK